MNTYADIVRAAAESRFTEPSDLLPGIDGDETAAYIARRYVDDELAEALAEMLDLLTAAQEREVFVHLQTALRHPELVDGIAGRLLRDLLLPAFRRSVAEHLSLSVERHRIDGMDDAAGRATYRGPVQLVEPA